MKHSKWAWVLSLFSLVSAAACGAAADADVDLALLAPDLATNGSDLAAAAPRATVRIGTAASTIKPLLGTNAGPKPASPQQTVDMTTRYQSIGVRSVRTHDHLIYPGLPMGPRPGPLDMATMYPNRATNPSQQSSYDFALADQHFGAIVAGGFEPFFRLGDSAGLTVTVLPTEHANWAAAAVEVIRHYTEGKWSGFNTTLGGVEIWNEPDSTGFWRRSRDEFVALFCTTGLALRAAFPTLRIGGPGFTQAASTDFSANGWMSALLDQVALRGAPLDFLSYHIYSNDTAQPAQMATQLCAQLDARGLTATKIYLTEWNTEVDAKKDLARAQALRNGAEGAATLTAQWIALQDAPVDGVFHYRGSDPNSNTAEDYGLFFADGTAKPAAWAFAAWAELAATTSRLTTMVEGDTAVRALTGSDATGYVTMLVVNYASTPTTWTPIDATGQTLRGDLELSTLSAASADFVTTTPTYPIALPAWGVQVLRQQ